MDNDDLLDLVRTTDWDNIEGARDVVEDVDDLLPRYWQLESWMQKVAFCQLVQDKVHDGLRPIMLDILRAPPDEVGDVVELTKAIALGFVDEKYDTFMRFYNDRAALHATVAEVLAANGLVAERGDRAPEVTQPIPKADPDDLETALFDACMAGDEATALVLVERGANVEATRVSDQTPLWWACSQNLRALATQLVMRGASVDRADRWGGTPLHQAAKEGHAELVRDLVRWGANIRPAYQDGRTPAWFAAYHGHVDATLALVDAGIGVDEPSSGKTLLALACGDNHHALVSALIARGADVNAKCSGPLDTGATPLMLAAQGGYPRIVELLLAAGADRSVKTGGKRAIDYATGRRADAVRALLR